MSARFLKAVEERLLDLVDEMEIEETSNTQDRLRALAREIAVEVEKIKLGMSSEAGSMTSDNPYTTVRG